MMRNTLTGRPLRLLLVSSLALLALACDGDRDPTATYPTATYPTATVPDANPAAALSISPPELSLIVGGMLSLAARAYDSAGRLKIVSFEWSSADPAIATVGKSNGTVTAISAGSTTVTAAVGAVRATATVSVSVMPVGAFAFTRTTPSSQGSLTSDVLFFSVADPTMRSLPRPGQFASIAAPAWSPDGTQLAVEVVHEILEDHGVVYSYSSDLYVLDAAAPAASPWRTLTANGFSTSPNWSPDGKRIAYLQQLATGNGIYITDVAGGAPVRLTRTEGWYGRPSWSPDGTRLAFGASGDDVFIINADGSGLTNVTRSSAHDYDPSWSPDGARLAFVSRPAGTGISTVSVVDVDGSNVRSLTSIADYARAPAWSPDGRQLIFSVQHWCCAPVLHPTIAHGLYVMNADGSSLVQLTTPPQTSWDSAPVWRR